MLAQDPLSEWLNVVSARCTLSGSLQARGSWSVGFATQSTKINIVTEGACWLVHEALPEPLPLAAGDGFMLTRADNFVLCTDPALTPRPIAEIYDGPRAWFDGGRGPAFTAIGCRIELDSIDAGLLLASLPPVVPVRAAVGQAATLRWLVEQLGAELAGPSAGSAASAALLAQLLFVETMRFWLQSAPADGGWLVALRDARIGGALRLLHADPSRPWRVEELARSVGMSRSAFAAQFKRMLDQSPLDYLVSWRMRLAARALRDGPQPLSRIAQSVGYQSDSAFSHAFKRVHGLAPTDYRRHWRNEKQGDDAAY